MVVLRCVGVGALFLSCALATGATAQTTQTYQYDALGRLVSTTYGSGATTAYTYDPADNRTARTNTAPPGPVAGADSVTVAYGASATFNPLTNDSSPQGYALSVTGVSVPAHGAASFTATSVTYTPNSGYSGSDSFTYAIADGHGGTATGTVTATVTPPPPVANASTLTVAGNSANDPVNLTLTGGAAASVAVYAQAAHGTATASGTAITYTPANGYSGTDSFQYTATNVGGTSAPATVSITVTAITQPPVAGAASATVAYGSTANPITLNLSGGAPASVAVSTQAAHGTATASGTSITYTPTSGYSGADSFAYTATNSGGTSAAATVSVTVTPQAPTAGAVSATVAQNSASDPIALILGGGTASSVSVFSAPSHGAATASGTAITYTPTRGYSGTDSFQYKATNAGGTSAAATVTITVAISNPPVAVNQSYSMLDTAPSATLNVLSGDSSPQGYTLTIIGVGTPSLGSVSINSGGTALTYVPVGDGTDTFTYTISDGHGGTATATVTVKVKVGGCKYC